MRKSAELLANADKSVHYDRKAAADELARLLSNPGAKTSDSAWVKAAAIVSTHARHSPEYNDKSLVTERIRGREFTSVIIDEVSESEYLEKLAEELELEESYEELIKAINKKFSRNKETFMLSAPMVLTVKRAKGYSKENHIGSEDFKPLKAYLGKKGQIILTFKPVMTTNYTEMEMEETQAKQHLMGFKEFFNEAMSGVKVDLEDYRKTVADSKEKEALKDRFEIYKNIGFGDW